jgi:hypothetical protein
VGGCACTAIHNLKKLAGVTQLRPLIRPRRQPIAPAVLG